MDPLARLHLGRRVLQQRSQHIRLLLLRLNLPPVHHVQHLHLLHQRRELLAHSLNRLRRRQIRLYDPRAADELRGVQIEKRRQIVRLHRQQSLHRVLLVLHERLRRSEHRAGLIDSEELLEHRESAREQREAFGLDRVYRLSANVRENEVEVVAQIAYSTVDLDELAEKGRRSWGGQNLQEMVHVDGRKIRSEG